MPELSEATITYWGSIASLLGIAISFLGFGLTLWNVWRSKTAAIAAQEAALEAKRAAQAFDTVSELSRVIESLETSKSLNRNGLWPQLLGRFPDARRSMISIKQLSGDASDDQQTAMQAAIATLAEIEREIERNLHNNSKVNIPKINRLVSDVCDEMQRLLTEFKSGGFSNDK